MKPTLPDRDTEEMSSDVSDRYRAGAQDEPSAKLDAAIRAAAHREVERPRQRRGWQVPASIAAMLVLGVSLVLVVRDNEPPLPGLERSAVDEAKLAKAVPPQLAAKGPAKSKSDFHREDRPGRERTARPEREPVKRDELADSASAGAAAQPAPAPASAVAPPAVPAAPPVSVIAMSPEAEQARIAESSNFSREKKAGESADSARESRPAVQALRKQEAAAPIQPKQWLDEIDRLLRDGKEAEARRQLAGFRQQYPQYPLPERLQALLPPEPGK